MQQWWATYAGSGNYISDNRPAQVGRNMCPRGLALHHPAASTLLDFATHGCPVNTGKPWTIHQMQTAIDRGPHASALDPEAIAQLDAEVTEKVKHGQATLVPWASIKHCPPPQLKISPLAMVPHKSRQGQSLICPIPSDLALPTPSHPLTAHQQNWPPQGPSINSDIP